MNPICLPRPKKRSQCSLLVQEKQGASPEFTIGSMVFSLIF